MSALLSPYNPQRDPPISAGIGMLSGADKLLKNCQPAGAVSARRHSHMWAKQINMTDPQ